MVRNGSNMGVVDVYPIEATGHEASERVDGNTEVAPVSFVGV
jgi:hypothetical protein